MRTATHGAKLAAPARRPPGRAARGLNAWRRFAPGRSCAVRADCRLALLAALLGVALGGCNSVTGQLNNQVGMWNYEQGNYAAAREEFYRALADDPQNASFACNLASAARRQGDLRTAEAMYWQAIHIDPSHQPSYHGLGQLLKEQGREAEALQVVSTWAEAHPHDAGAQIELAWIERATGDTTGAEQSLYRALAASPDNSIATAQLGQLYQETGQSDRAAAMYRRSLQSNWLQPQVQSRLDAVRNSPA